MMYIAFESEASEEKNTCTYSEEEEEEEEEKKIDSKIDSKPNIPFPFTEDLFFTDSQ